MDAPRVAVSAAGAAELLSVSERTIWAEIAAGRLSSFRLGKRRLIRVAELEAYAERREAIQSARPAPPRRAAPSTGAPLPFPQYAGDPAEAPVSPAGGRTRGADTKRRQSGRN